MHHQTYIDGIDRATERGLISYHGCDPYGPSDDFAHFPQKFGGYNLINTRALENVPGFALSWLRLARCLDRTKPLCALELGPGAGIAAATMAKHSTVRVETVSLTPINPYWIPQCSLLDVYRKINSHKMRDLLRSIGQVDYYSEPDELMKIQRMSRIQVFAVVSKPFIVHQRIGHLETMRRSDFPESGYDFIYDNCGALSYADLAISNRKQASAVWEKAAKLVYSLLSDNGALCLSISSKKDGKVLKKMLQGDDALFDVMTGRDHARFLAKAKSVLREVAAALPGAMIKKL